MKLYFQPYFFAFILSAGTIFGYIYHQNSYISLFTSIPLTICYGSIYFVCVKNKINIIRSEISIYVIMFMCIMIMVGKINANTTIIGYLLMGGLFTVTMIYEIIAIKKIVNNNKFKDFFKENPDYIYYRTGELGEIKNFLFRRKEKRFNFSETVFEINGMKFNEIGLVTNYKTINYEKISQFLKDSMINIKNLNKSDLETIEMMNY